MRPRPFRIKLLRLLAPCCALLVCSGALGGVTVGFDAPTLNTLLPAMTLDELDIPLAEGHSLKIFLEEMKILGFDPSAGDDGSGQILTSLRVRVPQLGISMPIEPRVSVHVVELGGRSVLELRFERADLRLPLAGKIDVASFFPPLRFPAESLFSLKGGRGDVAVRSRLGEVKMGQRLLRFELNLEVVDEP